MINVDDLQLTELSYGYSHMAMGSSYSYHLVRTYSGAKYAATYWPRDRDTLEEVFICVALDSKAMDDVAVMIRESGGAGLLDDGTPSGPMIYDAPSSNWTLRWSDGTKTSPGKAGGQIMSYLEGLKEKYAGQAVPLTEETSPFSEKENGYTIINYDDETMAYIDEINDRYAEKGLDPQSFRNIVAYETYKRKANQMSAFLWQMKGYEQHGVDPVDFIENIIRLSSGNADIQTGDLIEVVVSYDAKGLAPEDLIEYLNNTYGK